MPHNFLKSITVVLAGAVCGYSIVHYLKAEPVQRVIASAPISKLGQSQNARSLFEVKTDLSGLAASENELSTLRVSVIALKPFGSGLQYKWNLPAGVKISEGTGSESLPSFTAGQSMEFSIKVKGFSKQIRKYISFEIEGNQNDYRIHREVLLSSRLEDSLEYQIQQKELKRQESQNSKMEQKGNGRFDPKNIVR